MTERTTPITVHLTDKQMAAPLQFDLYDMFLKAIVAQRPRPIAVGDRVRFPGSTLCLDVRGLSDGIAWLWTFGSEPWGNADVEDLTRVDDEAQP